MTTTLKIAYPDIPKSAMVQETQNTYDDDFHPKNLITGMRHNRAQIPTAVDHEYVDYDLGDGNTSTCDYLCIARADLLKTAGCEAVRLAGSSVGRDAPTLYGTPTLWLKADAGITYNGSDLVENWADQSGNGYDFTQSTEGNRPTYKRPDDGINGMPSVYFDGVDNFMQTTATLGDLFDVDAKTLFVVVKEENRDSTYPIFWPSTSGHFAVSTNNTLFRATNTDAGGADTVDSGATGTSASVVAVTHDGATLEISANGETFASTASGNSTNTSVTYYLAYDSGSASYMQGHICEIIAYDAVLGTTAIDAIVEYLDSKWTRTPSVNNTGFDSQSLQGPHSADYLTTFTTSSAYRYWCIDYHGSAPSYFTRSKEYFGTLFDIGASPGRYSYNLIGTEDAQTEFSTGNVVFCRCKDPQFVFEVAWEKVSDAKLEDFYNYLLDRPNEDLVFLYTDGNDEILADQGLVHCRILSESVRVQRSKYTTDESLNSVIAIFEQVLG